MPKLVKRDATVECGILLHGLYESIDRLDFFARHRAADAQLNARYAESYVAVLRSRLAEIGAAITALSTALPSDEESRKTRSRPPKVRLPTLMSEGSSLSLA